MVRTQRSWRLRKKKTESKTNNASTTKKVVVTNKDEKEDAKVVQMGVEMVGGSNEDDKVDMKNNQSTMEIEEVAKNGISNTSSEPSETKSISDEKYVSMLLKFFSKCKSTLEVVPSKYHIVQVHQKKLFDFFTITVLSENFLVLESAVWRGLVDIFSIMSSGKIFYLTKRIRKVKQLYRPLAWIAHNMNSEASQEAIRAALLKNKSFMMDLGTFITFKINKQLPGQKNKQAREMPLSVFETVTKIASMKIADLTIRLLRYIGDETFVCEITPQNSSFVKSQDVETQDNLEVKASETKEEASETKDEASETKEEAFETKEDSEGKEKMQLEEKMEDSKVDDKTKTKSADIGENSEKNSEKKKASKSDGENGSKTSAKGSRSSYFIVAECLEILTMIEIMESNPEDYGIGPEFISEYKKAIKCVRESWCVCIRLEADRILRIRKSHAIFSKELAKNVYPSPRSVYILLSNLYQTLSRRVTTLITCYEGFSFWLSRLTGEESKKKVSKEFGMILENIEKSEDSKESLETLSKKWTCVKTARKLTALRKATVPSLSKIHPYTANLECNLTPPSVFEWQIPSKDVAELNEDGLTSVEFEAGGLRWFLQMKCTSDKSFRVYLHRCGTRVPTAWLVAADILVELVSFSPDKKKIEEEKNMSQRGNTIMDGNFGFGVHPFDIDPASIVQGKGGEQFLNKWECVVIRVNLSVDPGLSVLLNYAVTKFEVLSNELKEYEKSPIDGNGKNNSPFLVQLPLPAVLRIIRSDALGVTSEKKLLQTIVSWIQVCMKEKSSAEKVATAQRLLAYVRYDYLSFDELYEASRAPFVKECNILEKHALQCIRKDVIGTKSGGKKQIKSERERDGYRLSGQKNSSEAICEILSSIVKEVFRKEMSEKEMKFKSHGENSMKIEGNISVETKSHLNVDSKPVGVETGKIQAEMKRLKEENEQYRNQTGVLLRAVKFLVGKRRGKDADEIRDELEEISKGYA